MSYGIRVGLLLASVTLASAIYTLMFWEGYFNGPSIIGRVLERVVSQTGNIDT